MHWRSLSLYNKANLSHQYFPGFSTFLLGDTEETLLLATGAFGSCETVHSLLQLTWFYGQAE